MKQPSTQNQTKNQSCDQSHDKSRHHTFNGIFNSTCNALPLKVFLGIFLSVFVIGGLSVSHSAQAIPAKIKPMRDQDLTTTTATVRYKNVAASKKFQFQLWDKRVGRTDYRKVSQFKIKRKKKMRKPKILSYQLTDLANDRDYRIRYRGIYSGDRAGIWSDYRTFHTKNDSMTFTLTTTDTLPATETPYVEITAPSTNFLGAYPMTATGTNTWSVEIDEVQPTGDISYVYSRNGLGAPTYELFTPDNVDQRRDFTITEVPVTQNDTVENWRWLDDSINTGTVSTDNWSIANRDQLIMSMGLLDYHWDEFDLLVESTMQRIADQGFHYVTVYHAPRMITQGDPVKITSQTKNTQDDDQFAAIMTAAANAGLEVILVVGMEVDPNNADAINADLAGTHDDDYFSTYATRWKENARAGVDLAIQYNVPIVVLYNSFPFFTYSSDAQKIKLNSIIKGILPDVTNGYSGMVTTDYYDNDALLNWYNSSEIDWVGDKWFPNLTNSYDPTTGDMYTNALADIAARYDDIYATYGKPIFLNQLAIHSWDGAAGPEAGANSESEPYSEYYNDDPDNPADYQEQADAYEAVWRAIADTEYFVGAASFSYMYHTQYAKSANIRQKPAEQVWVRWNDLFDAQVNN